MVMQRQWWSFQVAEHLDKTKLALSVMMLTAIAVGAVSYYWINSELLRQPMASPAFGPGTQQYPNPNYTNVTVIGEMRAASISPACSLSTPPCAVAGSTVYYIIVWGSYYRLIFPNSTSLPASGSHIIVTGQYIVPSTYKGDQWMPSLAFRGDIYVRSFSYVFPFY